MYTFAIYMKDGSVLKLDGNNVGDAFLRNNLQANMMGNMDFFFKVPQPIEEKKEIHQFQIYLMETKDSEWKEEKKPSNNFVALEKFMEMKVKRDGCFSGMVVDLFTEKPVSWLWR